MICPDCENLFPPDDLVYSDEAGDNICEECETERCIQNKEAERDID